MANSFERTLRSVESDRGSLWKVAVLALLLAAWCAWFFFARVAVYVTTDAGRLEVARAVHSVHSVGAGRVLRASLQLGRRVQAGELLIELESDRERLELQETQARLAALGPEVDALRRQLDAEQRALANAQSVETTSVAQAEAQALESSAVAQSARKEAERSGRLYAAQSVSESEVSQARAAAAQRSAAEDYSRIAVSRIRAELTQQTLGRRARVEELRRELARLEGQQQTSAAAVRTLEYQIERHQIRSPTAGVIGETRDLQPGTYVAEGERICSVVPTSGVKAVADFPPSEAAGRIRSGQRGRLMLKGFPWTQYGSVGVVVTAASLEPRAGSMRVELSVERDHLPGVKLEHGMPTEVEVEVERVSPAVMVLRAAGKAMQGDGSGLGAPAPSGLP